MRNVKGGVLLHSWIVRGGVLLHEMFGWHLVVGGMVPHASYIGAYHNDMSLKWCMWMMIVVGRVCDEYILVTL